MIANFSLAMGVVGAAVASHFILLTGFAGLLADALSMAVSGFLVGASRAIFIGRPAVLSGFEMFVAGMGVALVTYLLGLLVGGKL